MIPTLLRSGCPPTVPRLVVAVVVDAVKRKAGPWAPTHVLKEVLELQPALAYGDAAAAVVLPPRVSASPATLDHVAPCGVLNSPGCAAGFPVATNLLALLPMPATVAASRVLATAALLQGCADLCAMLRGELAPHMLFARAVRRTRSALVNARGHLDSLSVLGRVRPEPAIKLNSFTKAYSRAPAPGYDAVSQYTAAAVVAPATFTVEGIAPRPPTTIAGRFPFTVGRCRPAPENAPPIFASAVRAVNRPT